MKPMMLGAFCLFSLVYLVSLTYAPYDYQFIFKVLPIAVLAWSIGTTTQGRERYLLLAAIVASGAGDVLLSISIENSFLFGLGAFLVAHIIYIILFGRFRNATKPQKVTWGMICLIGVFSLSMAFYLLPSTADLLVPVSFYLTVITLMAILAWVGNLPWQVKLGAISFLLSDAILAQSIFKHPIPFSGYWVMLTYYLAQGLIVYGVIAHLKTANTVQP